MERRKRSPSGTTSSEDTVLVRIVAKGVPADSAEFQERAKLPRSERGPNLALYHELCDEQKTEAKSDEPPAQ